MGKKHKAPSGRRARWNYGRRWNAFLNLYTCPVCGHSITAGEECPRCKKTGGNLKTAGNFRFLPEKRGCRDE